MHRVVVDHPHGLVSLIVSGFLSEPEVESAAAGLHRAIRGFGPRMGQHVTLYDLCELQVASATSLERFAGYFTDPAIAPLLARRVAIVVASALVQLQMQRVQRRFGNMQVFGSRREALAWLLEDQPRARTISHPTAASG